MKDFNSEKTRALKEFEDKWLESDPELEISDLQTAQELVLNPQRSPARWESILFIRIRNALSPEERRNFSNTIREFRAEKQQIREMSATANKRAKIECLKKIEHKKKKHELTKELQLRFETDFLNIDEFYRENCAAYLSIDEFDNLKTEFVQNWARKHLEAETNHLDSEQSAAVGAPNLDIQVIARAGSGKTTTIGASDQPGCSLKRYDMSQFRGRSC